LRQGRRGCCDVSLAQPEAGVLLDAKAIRLFHRLDGGAPIELRQSPDGCSTGDFELYYPPGALNPSNAVLCPGFCRWMSSWDSGWLTFCMDVMSGMAPDAGCTLWIGG
jgi:hypothetical protein